MKKQLRLKKSLFDSSNFLKKSICKSFCYFLKLTSCVGSNAATNPVVAKTRSEIQRIFNCLLDEKNTVHFVIETKKHRSCFYRKSDIGF